MSTERSAQRRRGSTLRISSFTPLYLIQYTCIGLRDTWLAQL